MTKHSYMLGKTGDSGIHSGRDRYWVVCVPCGKMLHENTTGPIENIDRHEREVARSE